MRLLLDKLAKIYPRTMLAEFHEMFGPAVTEKLLTIFAGTTLVIPSTKDLENAQRDVAIWETLRRSNDPGQSRRLTESLAQQHNIPHKKVRAIYYRMMRRLKANKRLNEAVRNVGQHRPGRMKTQHRSKRRL